MIQVPARFVLRTIETSFSRTCLVHHDPAFAGIAVAVRAFLLPERWYMISWLQRPLHWPCCLKAGGSYRNVMGKLYLGILFWLFADTKILGAFIGLMIYALFHFKSSINDEEKRPRSCCCVQHFRLYAAHRFSSSSSRDTDSHPGNGRQSCLQHMISTIACEPYSTCRDDFCWLVDRFLRVGCISLQKTSYKRIEIFYPTAGGTAYRSSPCMAAGSKQRSGEDNHRTEKQRTRSGSWWVAILIVLCGFIVVSTAWTARIAIWEKNNKPSYQHSYGATSAS